FTPSRLLFGIECGPGDALHIEAELPDTQEKVDVVSDREIAAERLLKNAEKQNIRFNKKRRTNVEFKRDDTVFVKPASTREAKLEKKYVGPFVICEVLDNDRFKIVGKSGKPQVVPKDRLRLWEGEWSGDIDLDSDKENAKEPC
ncbi:hypothetical protein KPH14_000796, partial [Odynerus spinipes]